ncbi:MAG: hypothetical protein M1839_001915 [Geoglossum umbratile]|nr:MAG: hypothetical protein M1839_001915 [Geoglossum umbratile]
MESSSALGDALVGRRKWTDPQVGKERDILLGGDDERARVYVSAGAYGHLEEMEKFFGENSYFYCQEHGLETNGEDAEWTPRSDNEEEGSTSTDDSGDNGRVNDKENSNDNVEIED